MSSTRAALLFAGVVWLAVPGVAPAAPRLDPSLGRLPLSFEANRGQADPGVKFVSRGHGYTMLLSSSEIALSLARPGRGEPALVRIRLDGGREDIDVEGLEPQPGTASYFIGNRPEDWKTGIPMFSKVRYRGVYPGIDLVFYGKERRLEYDLVLTPGADPASIRLAFDGVERLSTNGEGDLLLDIAGGVLRMHRPSVYQLTGGSRRAVAASYAILDNCRAGFRVEAFDPSRPLYIDPVLSFSAFLGGTGADTGWAVAVDSAGSAYVAGSTTSLNFPTRPKTIMNAYVEGTDVFVTKLDPSGTALAYSVYIGGHRDDEVRSIAVDQAGSAFIAGHTLSSDYPTTAGAFQRGRGAGASEGFVTKLDPTGSSLAYSSHVGGNGEDMACGISVDAAGNAYVVGTTSSPIFPLGSTSRRIGFTGGASDAFAVKVNPTGSAPVYAVKIGGAGTDSACGARVDSAGALFISGSTSSADFPVTAGAAKTLYGGSSDAFAAKLNATGDALIYGTYLGGKAVDTDAGIAIDSAGNAYVAGSTGSTDFPVTSGAFQTTFRASDSEAFLVKLTPAGAFAYSTYLGGNGNDYARGVAADSAGTAYVVGETSSANFPVTAGALQSSLKGATDAFVTRLNATGTQAVYSTYFGGASAESGNAIAVDAGGGAYFTGRTASADFPATSQEFHVLYGIGESDAFLTKIVDTLTPPSDFVSVSSASYVRGGAIAPGSIASGFGEALASGEAWGPDPLPETLLNRRVLVKDSGGTERAARLFYVGPGQINYQVPEETAPGVATVRVVETGGQVIATGSATIANVAPGVFTKNQDGAGVPAGQAIRVLEDNTQVREPIEQYNPSDGRYYPLPIELFPLNQNVVLELYGTGFRHRSPLGGVSVRIGGIDAQVEYTGVQPQYQGLDQLNVRLPYALVGRGEVEVIVTIDGRTANPVRINVK